MAPINVCKRPTSTYESGVLASPANNWSNVRLAMPITHALTRHWVRLRRPAEVRRPASKFVQLTLTEPFFQLRHAHLAAAGVKIAYRTQAVASNQQAVVVAIDTTIVSLAFEPSPRRKPEGHFAQCA